jgi:hypothetical protein
VMVPPPPPNPPEEPRTATTDAKIESLEKENLLAT